MEIYGSPCENAKLSIMLKKKVVSTCGGEKTKEQKQNTQNWIDRNNTCERKWLLYQQRRKTRWVVAAEPSQTYCRSMFLWCVLQLSSWLSQGGWHGVQQQRNNSYLGPDSVDIKQPTYSWCPTQVYLINMAVSDFQLTWNLSRRSHF